MNSSKKTRQIALVALSCAGALVALSPGESQAQVLVRRITGGPVSGLELSIEGPRTTVRGGHVQWQLAVHEVTGLSSLRAAPGARVRVLSTLSRERAMAEATSDALGRAELGFDVPTDAPRSFHVVFEAISRSNIRRQFDLDINVGPGRALQLFSDRSQVRPGGALHAWTRLTSTSTGRALANEPVVLGLYDARGRLVSSRLEARTDASGVVSRSLTLPRNGVGMFTVRATHRTEHESLDAARVVTAQFNAAPSLVVRASTQQSISEPRATIRVIATVRTADGRPVADALVRSPRIPRVPRSSEEPFVRTDARGIATFEFTAPELSLGASPTDLAINVSASRVGMGDGSSVAVVRLARAGLYGAAAIEGRSLIEGLPGKVYARVVRSDGSPVGAGVNVTLAGPRFGRGVSATTDADGVAVLDVSLGAQPAPRPRPARRPTDGEDGAEEQSEPEEPVDACGGTTATAFVLSFSEGNVRGSLNSCAPIEPDGTLRVRLRDGALTQPGAELHGTLSRLASVARMPVHVALIERVGDSYTPIAGTLVAAGASEFSLRVPQGARGLLLVRARPLFGAVGEPILGGSTAVWSHLGQRAALTFAQLDSDSLVLDAGRASAMSAQVSIVPREHGDALLEMLRQEQHNVSLGDLRVDFARAGEPLLAGAVASMVVRDESVQALLRAGRVVDLPAPASPSSWGTLRDPFRASSRFIEGRLALIFQRIENHVASMTRTRRADVGQRVGARWEFNREIFDAILRSGGEDSSGGARNLGGGPMTIDDLRRLDSAFTFDNVARRITRKRMFTLLVGLRQFVNQHSLDLRWSWRGDPTVWLRQLASEGEFTFEDNEGNSSTLTADDMVDGWGNRFALRPSPGGRARFGFLAPVAGYDLVSAGPDERMGTADDVVNPFARVLPSGGAYARAVDEDGLIARLNGVELGRATIARLGSVFESEVEGDFNEDGASDESSDDRAGPNWNELPSRLQTDPFALALLRPAADANGVHRSFDALNGATEWRFSVDDEPRTWMAIAHGVAADGTSVYASRSFVSGKPVLVSLPIAPRVDALRTPVPRVRVGEDLAVVATVTNLSDRAQRYVVSATGEGAVRVRAPSELRVEAGQSAELSLVLSAADAGPGAVRIELRDEGGALLRRVAAPLLADWGGLQLRDDAMGLAQSSELSLRSTLAADARNAHARLVIEAPMALADDPELDRVRRTDPALIAWSYTLAGRPVPRALMDALLAAQSPSGEVTGELDGRSNHSSALLSTALSLSVWASADEDDAQAQQALALSRSRLSALRAPLPDSDPVAGRVRADAAALAALATGAPTASGASGVDPVELFTAQARESLRAIHSTHTAQPTVLARAAAALLLLDATDARGRQMYERAKASIVDEGARGALVAAGEGRVRIDEVLSASAAMAIAAQQRGDLELARKLARGVAVRGHLAMRAGGEVAFWLLADAAFGVFGLESPAAARVAINGVEREVALVNGRAALDLDPRSAVTVRAASAASSLIARVETLYDRPAVAQQEGPVSLAIQGDVGYASETSALELVVTGTSETAAQHVVIEAQLPAGSLLDMNSVRAARSIGPVELRDGGLLRIRLQSIAKNQVVTIPLALQWLVRGAVQGLGVTAYAEDRPTRWTVLPARAFALEPRPRGASQSGSSRSPAPLQSPRGR